MDKDIAYITAIAWSRELFRLTGDVVGYVYATYKMPTHSYRDTITFKEFFR